MGAPLSSSRKGSATKKAKKKLDSIEGAGVFSGWFHAVMYLWGWIVAVSIFTLYWDIVYDGVVLPALLLPFLMVYLGARWPRLACSTRLQQGRPYWACRASTRRR